MNLPASLALLVFAALTLVPQETCAQETSIFGRQVILPDPVPNSRFALDELSVQRPALTLNGFDCTEAGSCNRGYGWAEVMRAVETNASDTRYFYQRAALSTSQFHGLTCTSGVGCSPAENNSYFATPDNFGGRTALDVNTRRLQTLAFFTLTSFLLERNGIPRHRLDSLHTAVGATVLPHNYETMRGLLISTLATIPTLDYFDIEAQILDADKQRVYLSNLARAVDLYLGLENAYLYYLGPNDAQQYLLPQADKDRLMSFLIGKINHMRQRAVDPPVIYIFANRLAAEPGNLATLVRATCGYASLAYQKPHTRTTYEVRDGYSALDHVDAAIKATIEPANGNDAFNYAYTSGEGLPMWAEGPYYLHYAAGSVLQFWHATRTTQLNTRPLSYIAGRVPDPFLQDRLMAPLHWLADLTTPQGETPPFDDGNRHRMNTAHLLAWGGNYGSYIGAEVGTKFASIDRMNPGARDDNYALLSLSIPRVALGAETAPRNVYGYGSATELQQTDQVVVRKPGGGANHYLAVNAEGLRSPSSIDRGHGHEQPDNLSLVYYVDNTSVIMDQGYDDGGGLGGSFRNNYRYQNVVFATDAGDDCEGLPVPYKLASPPSSSHAPASELWTAQRGFVQHVHARQPLNTSARQPLDCLLHQSDYTRDVLVVGEFEYVIDMNANLTQSQTDTRFGLRYALDTQGMTTAGPTGFFVSSNLRSKANDEPPTLSPLRAYMYPMPVETSFWAADGSGNASIAINAQREVRERANDQHVATELTLLDPDKGRAFTTASIIATSAGGQTYTPKTLWAYGGTRSYQGLTWQRSSSDFDVLVVRSAGDPGTAEVKANAAYAGAGYPKLWLSLPAGKRFGFARVRAGSPTPTLVAGYALDLAPTTAPPLAVSHTWPGCTMSAYTTNFTAHGSGGLPPFTDYTFETKPTSCGGEALAGRDGGAEVNGAGDPGDGGIDAAPSCEWSYAASGANVAITRYEPYYVRVRVTDSEYHDAYGSEEYIPIAGSCTAGGGGGAQPALFPEVAGALAPAALTLEPAAPNPFDARTTLRFGLPAASDVRLSVYDVLGREVTRLATGTHEAGWHTATVSGDGLAPGVYVVRLVAGGEARTRLVTLQR